MSRLSQVFLSYAREDRPDAQRVHDGLTKRGLRMWFDQVDMRPGKWKPQVERAISRSRYFLILLSNSALRKTGEAPGFVDEELNHAYHISRVQPEDDFTIVPALLEDCDRGDHRLSSFQQYALYAGWDAHLDNLSVALGGDRLSDGGQRPSEEELAILRHGARSEAYHYAGDYERAVESWEELAETVQGSIVPWFNMGNAFWRLGRYEMALTAYRRVLMIDEDSVNTWYNRGRVLVDLGRLDEAIASFDRALAIDPADVGVINARNQALKRRAEGQ